MLTANPHLRGVVCERQGVVAGARAAIAEHGLAERCEVVAGDFLESVPAVEADVVIMSHIIHDWDDERALSILRNTRAAMRPDDRLLLAEAILEPGDEPHPSKQADITMLVWCDGRERTLEERVLSRAQLLEQVWGTEYYDDHVVDVHLANLRHKLEPDPAHSVYVETMRGVGYRFGIPEGPTA
jgi:O-methyltransferase domain/Transcriptional regulatory protein, C terminal